MTNSTSDTALSFGSRLRRSTSRFRPLAMRATSFCHARTFPARALAERPDAPSAAVRLADVQAAGDKEDPVEAARRYARLVVSEIKLYHESAVVAGRKARDLMTRLGGEISRARTLYDQRVPADVREGHDYFEDELVKTLAGGDATLVAKR